MVRFTKRIPIMDGFTLIELLVVIAIISLLVSILLPSLTKAKDLAKLVSCMSNLRAFGIATMAYANDEKEKIPAIAHYNTNPVSDYSQYRTWKVVLAPYLDIGYVECDSRVWHALWGDGVDYKKYIIFFCPSATDDMRTTGVPKPLTTHYRPNAFWRFPSPPVDYANTPWPRKSPQLSWFHDSSSAVMNMDWYGRMDGQTPAIYPNCHELGRNLIYVDCHVSTLDLDFDEPSDPSGNGAGGLPIPKIREAY